MALTAPSRRPSSARRPPLPPRRIQCRPGTLKAVDTGVAYLPFVVGVGVASDGLRPRLLGAIPARIVIAAAMLLCAGELAWYVAMLAGGTATGLTFVGCTTTGMQGVAPRDSGVAAGLLNTSMQTGSALGLGALASSPRRRPGATSRGTPWRRHSPTATWPACLPGPSSSLSALSWRSALSGWLVDQPDEVGGAAASHRSVRWAAT